MPQLNADDALNTNFTLRDRFGEEFFVNVLNHDVELHHFGIRRLRCQPEPELVHLISYGRRLFDVGFWSIGSFVAWNRSRSIRDFHMLDTIDEMLREFFPPDYGRAPRAAAPASIPSVRLSPTRGAT